MSSSHFPAITPSAAGRCQGPWGGGWRFRFWGLAMCSLLSVRQQCDIPPDHVRQAVEDGGQELGDLGSRSAPAMVG